MAHTEIDRLESLPVVGGVVQPPGILDTWAGRIIGFKRFDRSGNLWVVTLPAKPAKTRLNRGVN